MSSEAQGATKVCRLCRTEKPVEEYYIRKEGGKNRPRTECKECIRELARYRVHGVCSTKYDEMMVKQKGCCAVCSSKIGSSRYTRLAVDHCHKTGKVRGLLCSNCNTAIGLMKDSPVRMQKAIQYLERTRSDDIV